MSTNYVQMSVDKGINEIEMRVLEKEYEWDVVDNVGDNIIRAAHILDETHEEFKHSNIMRMLRKEGNTLFVFSDFGENVYEEVEAFKMRGRDYEKLVIKNRKKNSILVRKTETNRISILDVNWDLIKQGRQTYLDEGYELLDSNQSKVIDIKDRNEFHVMLGKSVKHLTCGEQPREAA